MPEPTDNGRDLLLACLDTAVPLHLFKARSGGGAALRARAQEDAEIIACGYDVLVRADASWRKGDKDPAPHELTKEQADAGVFARSYRPAELFNAVARGVSVGALQPGGVTMLGRHWCVTPHEFCPNGHEPPEEEAKAAMANVTGLEEP
jgi:hypothetical protein